MYRERLELFQWIDLYTNKNKQKRDTRHKTQDTKRHKEYFQRCLFCSLIDITWLIIECNDERIIRVIVLEKIEFLNFH